jgi:hypothetical protein
MPEWKSRIERCDECSGTGTKTCYACEHEGDCDECEGTGKVTDEGWFPEPVPFLVNDFRFCSRYLRMIAELPGARCCVKKRAYADHGILLFKFDHGEGVLVGMTKTETPARPLLHEVIGAG